jgi:hypothetical protein
MSDGRGSKPKRPRKPMPPGREARPPRPDRGPRPAVALAEPTAGRGIVVASWVGTGLLTVTAVAGAIAPHTLGVPALVVALLMFFGGIGAFAWAYLVAIGRSRESEITLGGVFGLAGSAPGAVRVRLFAAFGAQVVVAVATAAARPYSSLSFEILAVMWGLGMIGLWGAKYGAFPPRQPGPAPKGRRAA